MLVHLYEKTQVKDVIRRRDVWKKNLEQLDAAWRKKTYSFHHAGNCMPTNRRRSLNAMCFGTGERLIARNAVNRIN